MTISSKVPKRNKRETRSSYSLRGLETFLARIDTVAEDADIDGILEDQDLLQSTFYDLLKIKDEAEGETAMDALEVKFSTLLKGLVDENVIEEDDYEDILADDFAESESEMDSEYEESESQAVFDGKNKSKHLQELEMLMEEVEDESDLSDDDEDSVEEEAGDAEEGEGLESEQENSSTTKNGKLDIFSEDRDDGLEGKAMSSFERQQKALREEISLLEAENIEKEKPWALRGEINARQRPADSLLEESVDFEHLSRPAPQITEERSEEIEDVIKRRIQEAAWDDVLRKDGRDLTLLNGMAKEAASKRPLLEDVAAAAPKQSLTEVYERNAEAKLLGSSHGSVDEATREKQSELTAMFAKICRHIDGLSGNRFAPKVYAQSEIQIKTLGKK